jgi:two-component system response regulator RegX3
MFAPLHLTPKARVLVVEGAEPANSSSDVVATALETQGCEVEVATDISTALELFKADPPDLVLLQSRSRGSSWVEMCQRMRSIADVPILIGFRLESEIDAVLAFELGAVGYVSESGRVHELLARVRAALRFDIPTNKAHTDSQEPFYNGSLRVDFVGREVTLNRARVHLPRLEFDLLAMLLSPPNRLRTRAEIVEQLWPDRGHALSRTLDTHVRRLRLRLEKDPKRPRHLITVRGVGFRFDTGDPQETAPVADDSSESFSPTPREAAASSSGNRQVPDCAGTVG